MAVLYVVEQGAILSKKGERLVIRKGNEVLEAVPIFALDQVVVFGNAQVSAPARNLLLDRGIDTVFLTPGGRFRGRLSSYSGGNIELRRAQFQRCAQDEFLVDLGRRIVVGKLTNARTLLQRYQRRLQCRQVEQALVRMRATLSRLDRAENLDQLRGCEGEGSAAYFGCFGELLANSDFFFKGRNRRPPRDPMNALLSFGYTSLLGTVLTAVQVVGLDPFLGALHAPARGRPSVALDLMEEFRSLLVDAVAIRAANRRQLRPEEFVYRPEVEPPEGLGELEELTPQDYPVLLGRVSIKKWIALYEEQLQTRIHYERYGCRLTYQQVVTEQARLLARHFMGEEEYVAFTVR